MIALNAGAALYVAGIAESIFDGVSLANEMLASGAGLEKMTTIGRHDTGFLMVGSFNTATYTST